jgi:RND family efflux transporter MFP subunit
VLEINNLVKRYGSKFAVDDISFSVGDGEIVGFLGPNGAGKSTTMNILTGYLSATSGNVLIDGIDIAEEPTKAKKLIGYLPEQPPLYMDMTVLEYLNFVFDLKGCQENKKLHIKEICEVTKISDVKKRLIKNLSKGYKQRVGIASALVGNPKFIILDEPTVGLDPKQIIEIRNLIRNLGKKHTVILSTHILPEVQAICDRVIIINNGKLIANEKTSQLNNIVGQSAKLMTLSAKSIAAGDPAEKARVAYETAKAEYERMEALVADKIVSAKAFAQAKEAYENARIAYEAVGQSNAASGTSITAPLGGYVKNLLVKEGDYVSVGQPLVSITQDQRLSLRADVPQRHYQALSSIESANFCTPYNKEVYELKALNGRLLSYGKSASENGNMIPITFEFDNRGKVMPGSFVEVYLLGAAQADAIALPLTALTEEQGSYYIYKQVHPERYMKQLVSLGASDGTRVQILSGVSAGDKVVMRGAYQVKLANTSNAIPGHSHEH